jgi:hypothetical protein
MAAEPTDFMTSSQIPKTATSPHAGRWFVPIRSNDRRDRGCRNESRKRAAWGALETRLHGHSTAHTCVKVSDPDIEKAADSEATKA